MLTLFSSRDLSQRLKKRERHLVGSVRPLFKSEPCLLLQRVLGILPNRKVTVGASLFLSAEKERWEAPRERGAQVGVGWQVDGMFRCRSTGGRAASVSGQWSFSGLDLSAILHEVPSVMPKGKAISHSSRLHAQGAPCCTLITNLIWGNHLPDTTTLLSSHTGSLFWSHLECLLML